HRLSTADARPAIAAKRQTEPAKLGRMVKGELDWIVLKALSKDRDRRYETATGLARDVERFLNREPVAAGPPSAAYRARKFVARNRAAVTAAGLVLLALVAGVAGTTWQAVRAEVARAEAEQQRQNALAAAETERAAREAEADQRAVAQAKQAEAEDQRRRAEAGEKLAGDRLAQVEAERRKAAEEAGIARAVKDFLQNKLLAQTDTTVQADALVEAGGSASGATLNPTVRELLDRAARELTPDKTEASFPNQPRVQAEILHTVGDTYRRIGEYRPAIDLLKRSNALLRLHHGPDHPDTLASTSVLAHACQEAGRPDLALPLYEEALALTKARFGPDHLDTLTVTIGLARAYRDAGRHDRAVPLFERTLAVRKDRLGPDHPDTLSSMGHLGVAYHAAGEPDRALPLCREAYTRRKAQLGPDHPLTLASMADLAQAYLAAGRPDRAVPLYEAALALRKVKLGPDHPETLGTMNNLGAAYHAAGRPDRAVPLLEEGQVLRKAKLGPDHPSTLAAAGNLATAYWAGRRYDRSVPLLEDTLTRQEVKLGRDHPNTVTTAYNLGVNYRDAGRAAEAVPLLERVYALWARDPARRRTIGWDLYTAYARAGRPADAARVVGEVLAQERAGHEPGSPGLGGLLAAYGKILTDLDPAAAEPVLRECLELREKLNPTAWNTANAKSLLGGALVGLGRLAEAEPLLVAGYAGLLADRANIPPPAANNLPDAADRLVELYVALGKPDEAKRWRAERAKYPFVAPPPRPAK
ncbi:MAG: tetratricopeptide repeat protein, partial [Gemmataceae bacterium]|nr:tetratricopeptide repeat protein [Gemmataceae bacterium]